SKDACVICLEDITERAITAPCNHCTFDFLCLVSWLQERPTCPLCKAEVTAVQYDWRTPEDFKTYFVRSIATTQQISSTYHENARSRLPRRLRTARRPHPPPGPDTALLRRRHVYRRKLYSLHVGSNQISQYRDLTPQTFAQSAELQSRAKAWIRRELRVFSFLDAEPDQMPSEGGATTSSNAEFLLSYIIAILRKVDLKSSNGHAEDLLQEFLGRDNTRLFLHELGSWLRSPYTRLGEWDRTVQYREEL
ncbi:hypothetical protein EJ04DRAFT_417702, partial [Polyplosphaeria fusca]